MYFACARKFATIPYLPYEMHEFKKKDVYSILSVDRCKLYTRLDEEILILKIWANGNNNNNKKSRANKIKKKMSF